MAQTNLSPIFTLKVNLLKGRGNQSIRVAQILVIYHSHFLLHLYLIILIPNLSILQCTNNMNASPLFPKFKHLWSVFIVSQTECGTREVMGSKGYKQLDWLVGDWCSSGRKNGLQQRAKFMLDSNISVLVLVVALEKTGGKDQINAKYDKSSNLICWVKNTRHFQL